MSRPVIAVWFSCGAASAAAAYLTLKAYGRTHDVRILNNFVLEEDEDNRRFLHDVERWLGQKIEDVAHPDFPSGSAVSVWDARKYMSGVMGAPCTTILKKEARRLWEEKNPGAQHVLGFTVEELGRHQRFIRFERPLLPVLIAANMTKQGCYSLLNRVGIRPPAIYAKGFPNANCIGCVKATSPTYWNLVRREYPAVFEARARQSRALGARLVRVNNERIFLDELDPSAKGRPLDTMADIECGVFCEETQLTKRRHRHE